ncbi:MAG: ABC transporter ATP-binding protein [Oscillospiraceae bacterium]|nr:ABC transporter ATP-binding protein [Oscillospiraceae bacterium]
MLKFENATKGYGAKKALNNLNVSFEPGKVYALVGPNGSGKSTMMKVAAGLVKLSSGHCTYCGIPIGVDSKSKIAYMSTEPFYYDYMKISDVAKYYHDFFSDFSYDRFNDLLKFMQLDPGMKIKSLSSGMAAKLKITATLSRDAQVIMLDEPLNGIDLLGRDQIINAVIKATNPSSTFIISSHLFDELETIVDNVVMIKNGCVALEGELEAMREEHGKSISDLYREIYAADEGLSSNIWGK